MDSALDGATLESLTAPVQFTVKDGETPVALVQSSRVEGPDDRTGMLSNSAKS